MYPVLFLKVHLTKKYFSNELQIYENITMQQIKKIDQKTIFL